MFSDLLKRMEMLPVNDFSSASRELVAYIDSIENIESFLDILK